MSKTKKKLSNEDKLRKIVAEHLNMDLSQVTKDARFVEDLGATSLDTIELVMRFEEEFGYEIPYDAAERIQTIEDALKFLEDAKP